MWIHISNNIDAFYFILGAWAGIVEASLIILIQAQLVPPWTNQSNLCGFSQCFYYKFFIVIPILIGYKQQ